MKTWPRVSIRGMMLVVLVLGVGAAGLRNASFAWDAAARVFTFGLLGASVPGVVYRREGHRAWWLGFGVFGGGYAVLTLAPWVSRESDSLIGFLDTLYARISPSQVLTVDNMAAAQFIESGQVVQINQPYVANPGSGPAQVVLTVGTLNATAFRGIGHCLLGLFAGAVGGFVARWFHTTRDDATTTP